MKKLLSCILAAALSVTLFTSCGNQDASTNSDSKGQLVMATEAGFAPYEYIEGGKVAGIDVDIANEIAKEMGKELVIKDMDFTNALAAAQNGKADFAAAGISITPERLETMDFTIEYATSKQVVVVKSGDNSVTSEESLSEKVIGVQAGTTGDLVYGDKENPVQPKELKSYKKYSLAADDLKKERIDCIVMDELPAKLLVEANGGELEISNTELFTDAYGFAIKKGNTELQQAMNKVLQRLMDEGKIEEFTEKHVKASL